MPERRTQPQDGIELSFAECSGMLVPSRAIHLPLLIPLAELPNVLAEITRHSSQGGLN